MSTSVGILYPMPDIIVVTLLLAFRLFLAPTATLYRLRMLWAMLWGGRPDLVGGMMTLVGAHNEFLVLLTVMQAAGKVAMFGHSQSQRVAFSNECSVELKRTERRIQEYLEVL